MCGVFFFHALPRTPRIVKNGFFILLEFIFWSMHKRTKRTKTFTREMVHFDNNLSRVKNIDANDILKANRPKIHRLPFAIHWAKMKRKKKYERGIKTKNGALSLMLSNSLW